MKNIFILLILITGISTSTFAREKTGREKRGDKFYFVYSFEKAIKFYSNSKKLTVEGQRRLAKSYENMNRNQEAETAYLKLLNMDGGNMPEDQYNYAMILKANGKYDQSMINMDKFASMAPSDLRAKDYMQNKNRFAEFSKDDGTYKINKQDFNSDAEDFAPTYFNNKLVFVSSRGSRMYERKYNWSGKPYLDLYVSEPEQNEFKSANVFDKKINRKLHDGPASFGKNGNLMAFTRNNYEAKRKDKLIELQIFFSTYADEKWSDPEPFLYNNTEYSVGHPSLSADGNTIYFISDMPGGYGGSDVYRTNRTGNGDWSKPENLGSNINTEGDELFPYYEETNGLLFFTSNGRFGIGGMDIFISALNGTETSPATNAGYPLNTQYDDFGVIVDPKLKKGYFSSNRSGGSGDVDIYSVDILKELKVGKKLKGIAKDVNGSPVAFTYIILQTASGTTIDTVTTQEDGAYSFFIESDKEYKLTGKKAGYIDGTNTANSFGDSYTVTSDVSMLKKEEIIAAAIKPGADLAVVLELNSIYFDLDKSNIRPDAEKQLDEIVKIMNLYPTMIVEFGSYTDCRESQAYNQVLSDKRAKSSADYIKKRITHPERISGKGYGKVRLVNGCSCDGDVLSDCSEEQHQQNRRTEFIIKQK